MAVNVEEITFKKGEIISKDGAFEMWMYDLKLGSVAYYADYDSPSAQLINEVVAPAFLGELGFFGSMPRLGTCVAKEDCVMCKITHENLTEYFSSQPAKIMQILEYTSAKTRKLIKQYVEACDTINEYLEAESKGLEKSENLILRMKRFASSYVRFRR